MSQICSSGLLPLTVIGVPLEVEDIGAWVKWLRTPETARAGAIAVLPTVSPAVSMRTVRRKLAAVDSFFVFHARHDDLVRLCLTRWYPGGQSILSVRSWFMFKRAVAAVRFDYVARRSRCRRS